MDEAWLKEMRQLASQARKVGTELLALAKQATGASQSLRGLVTAIKPLSTQFRNVEKSIRELPRGFKDLLGNVKPLAGQFKNAFSNLKSTIQKFSSATKGLDKSRERIRRIGPPPTDAAAADGKNGSGGKLKNYASDAAGFLFDFFKESVKVSGELERQKLQLKNLTGSSYPELEKALKNAADQSRNLFSPKEMNEAAKAALEYGASIDFITRSFGTFEKVAATTGRKMSDLYSLSEAERKTLLEKYTRDQKAMSALQEEYNRIILSGAYADQQFSNSLEKLHGAVGHLLVSAGHLADKFASVVNYFADSKDGAERLENAFVALVSLTNAFTGPVITTAFAVRDLILWLKGGESAIGNFFGPFADFKNNVINSFMAGINWIKNAFNNLVNFFRTYGRLIITLLFPIAGIFLYFDQIKTAFISLFAWISKQFAGGVFSKLASIINMIEFGDSSRPPGKASGGPVSAGKTYLVGERGPELFSPGSSGKILPNGTFGGSNSIVIQSVVGTLTVNVSGPAAAGQEIKDAVLKALDELSQDVLPARLGMAIP
ncbi:hypothetical protein [Leptospira fluminis]|uniref:hypothetical protein n=1 Tax=Leptospira fluminis TaxID=2484979 RepID=UPI001AEF48B3|nr:hypothetical protein [Leptospira fluminis]